MQQVSDLLARLHATQQALAVAQENARNTPEARLVEEFTKQAAGIQDELRRFLDGTGEVLDTPAGKAGWQIRRSITYTPAGVRALAPDLAPLVISETVDAAGLKTMAKAAIKAGKAPGDLLEQLEAAAEVKETRAWICQPRAPEPLDVSDLPF